MSLQPVPILLTVLGAAAVAFAGFSGRILLHLHRKGSEPLRPDPASLLIGFATMFFDTLGIGSFATTTALLRARRLLPDHLIPGTLNAGHSLASILQAFIYVTILPVDGTTLVLMVAASTTGAWFGAGLVSGWPRRRVQAGMGAALLVAAVFMLLGLLKWLPSGGSALGLQGWLLAVAVAGNLLLGALMTLGIGLFAPCMTMLSFLGVDPKAIFPIMMASCAFLMPAGGLRFLRAGRCSPRVALALTLGGIPAVLVAAFLVKELPLTVLRWIVLAVVVYTGTLLLRASTRPQTD